VINQQDQACGGFLQIAVWVCDAQGDAIGHWFLAIGGDIRGS
jgi:hypothetical protein